VALLVVAAHTEYLFSAKTFCSIGELARGEQGLRLAAGSVLRRVADSIVN
jgi:hypothetical protein